MRETHDGGKGVSTGLRIPEHREPAENLSGSGDAVWLRARTYHSCVPGSSADAVAYPHPRPSSRYAVCSVGHSLSTSELHSFAVPQKNFTFHWLQISSFPSRTSTHAEGVAWLGELQTQSWSNASNTIRFVKPWAKGTFSRQQWDQIQHIFLGYRSSFTKDIRKFAQMLFLKCELRDGILGRHLRCENEHRDTRRLRSLQMRLCFRTSLDFHFRLEMLQFLLKMTRCFCFSRPPTLIS